MKFLDDKLRQAYSNQVPEKKGAWGESQNILQRTTASKRLFFVRTAFVRLQWRALVGVPSGTPVAVGAGLSTLPCARHPRLRARSGSPTTYGGSLA